jgi:hypothetical protein
MPSAIPGEARAAATAPDREGMASEISRFNAINAASKATMITKTFFLM